MSNDDKYLRDLFAGFAMIGIVQMNKEPYDDVAVAELSYNLADAMMATRNKEEEYAEKGITAIKKRNYARKVVD
jgi:hypothetical protein